MQRCDKDCFNCRFSDCINGALSPSDYIELVEIEREVGVFQPEDEQYYYIDLLSIVKSYERKARQKKRARNKRHV